MRKLIADGGSAGVSQRPRPNGYLPYQRLRCFSLPRHHHTSAMEIGPLLAMLLQPTSAALIVLVLASTVSWLAYSYERSHNYLRRYPWVGVDKKKWFGLARGATASFRHAAQYGLEGYTEVRCCRLLAMASPAPMATGESAVLTGACSVQQAGQALGLR